MQPQHYTLTLVLSMSIAYLVIVRSYTFIHVCPLTQFIIIVLCICLLNHLRNKKKLQAKNINTTRFHNCLCGYFDQRFCFLHLASSCHLVSLCFSLKDAPSRFQQGGLGAGLCPVTSVVSDSVTLWIVAPRLLCPGEFPGKKYWSGLPCPPPGGLPNWESNLCLLSPTSAVRCPQLSPLTVTIDCHHTTPAFTTSTTWEG